MLLKVHRQGLTEINDVLVQQAAALLQCRDDVARAKPEEGKVPDHVESTRRVAPMSS